jgi:zinc protease
VVEEWRSYQGAAQRLSERQFEHMLANSRYAKRLPIGSIDVIKSVTGDTIRSFYAAVLHKHHIR